MFLANVSVFSVSHSGSCLLFRSEFSSWFLIWFLSLRRIERLRLIAKRKGRDGKPERWFSSYDAAKEFVGTRHCRKFLVDLTLICLNASPLGHGDVNFEDSLDDVFTKTGQSLVAAAHVLRDERLHKVFLVRIFFSSPHPPSR